MIVFMFGLLCLSFVEA